jgi:hypothetical protein
MYKLFTDKAETFECNIQLEGASVRNSQARLVVESKDITLMFRGEIDGSGTCKIPIKRLKGLLDESASGTIKLEVIADDTYFVPWDSKFQVETARKVTVEVKSTQTAPVLQETRAKVTVTKTTAKTTAVAKNSLKESLTSSRKKHIVSILKMLQSENININNIATKRPRLNEILGGYVVKHKINESECHVIIGFLLQGLSKLK